MILQFTDIRLHLLTVCHVLGTERELSLNSLPPSLLVNLDIAARGGQVLLETILRLLSSYPFVFVFVLLFLVSLFAPSSAVSPRNVFPSSSPSGS